MHLEHARPKGSTIIKIMNNSEKRILPDNVRRKATYTGQKLGTKIQIKDKTDGRHTHGLVYESKCPEQTFYEKYVTETGRKVERSTGHFGKDKHRTCLHMYWIVIIKQEKRDFHIIDCS